MTSYSDVCERWVSNCLGRQHGNTERPIKTERVYPEGDRIFSYGSHFEMARALRYKDGSFRAFLVNGDRFSVSTSGHQSRLRSAIGGCSSVIVPYSALDAAGVDRGTIEIVDVLPDRTVTKRHSFAEMQPGWRWRNDPIHAWRDQTTEELQAIVDRRNARERKGWEDRRGYALKEQVEQQARIANGEKPKYQFWSDFRDGGPQGTWTDLTINDLSGYERNREVRYVVRHERRLYQSHTAHAPEVEIEYDEHGTPVEYWYETSRHWLGESLIRAKVPYRVTVKCKDCGGFGAQPRVIEGGYYENVDEYGCGSCGWRGRRTSGRIVKTYRRTALFLSGFDHNETRDLYFFSELPVTTPTTVEEAYEALKPDTVKIAEQMGREVLRQGDIFAVPMADLDKRRLRKMGATFERRGTLLGTNHVATEVARFKDGRTLARGTLTHSPDFRVADHKRVALPKGTWCLTVKNTVPVSA